MKTSNYILKAMENLQTNVALLTAVKHYLLSEKTDEDYDKISDAMAEKELPRPSLAIESFNNYFEEIYNYLEQLMITIEKPF